MKCSCDDAGICQSTMHSWRQPKGGRIDRYILSCIKRSDDKRTDIVEDAFFKKLAIGAGSTGDYVFYLTNRRPERWKHYNNTQNSNVPLKQDTNIVIIRAQDGSNAKTISRQIPIQ